MIRGLTIVGLALASVVLAPLAVMAQEEEQAVETPANPVVLMKTNLGEIEIELYPEKAPITVENFLGYVEDGFYDGTVFHRVIKGFMIQGGGFDAELNQKSTKDPIKNEANNGLSNSTGTIAMARTSNPQSATAQFFINTVNNQRLNFTSETQRGWGYAVFGEVVSGMDVVRAIEATPTGPKGRFRSDVPQEMVIIESVTLKE
jgi:peptidyl-prolyl cis-trans isomerase A (cyclophilin A)/peptidyl-prolyl cis-trans isomerase B (cyclophilin B)